MNGGLPRLGDWDSFDELTQLQDKALARTLELARGSPFYRSLVPRDAWPSGRTGLAGVPLTTKRDLRAAYPFGMLAVPRQRLATYHESSGTSGEPTSSYFTDQDWQDVVSRFARTAVAFDPSDTVLVRTPYSMLTTAHQAHHGARSLGATVVPADNRSLVMPYSRVVRLLHDLPVTVAWCLPSECLLWAAAAHARGYDPRTDFPRLRAFLVAGEPLGAARKASISAAWGGVPVFQDYGSTETGSLAGECPYGALHLWADRFLGEVRDPVTGRCGPDGVGELVITTFYREAMPLVRYNLADTVEVEYGDCRCGWRLPTVRVSGRGAGRLTVGGGSVSQPQLEAFVFGLPAEYRVWFWRARRGGDVLEMQIEVAPEHRSAACAELTAALRRELRLDCVVTGVAPGGLVPAEVFTTDSGFTKPRNVFDEHEDWTKAVIYY